VQAFRDEEGGKPSCMLVKSWFHKFWSFDDLVDLPDGDNAIAWVLLIDWYGLYFPGLFIILRWIISADDRNSTTVNKLVILSPGRFHQNMGFYSQRAGQAYYHSFIEGHTDKQEPDEVDTSQSN